ncbi:MAG: FKBP-type peptidyl-prolyl cis-trans isomerase [Lachnospiraceae bacterium]
MKKETQKDDVQLSLSKQKRLEREKKRVKNKREKLIWKIAGIVLAVLLVGLIVAAIAQTIYFSANSVTASSDYSAQLTDDGFIKDVNASSNITLADYKTITVPLSEVEYSDDSVEADIQTQLDNYPNLSMESGDLIADGDKISIDFVGTVDGEEFEGGSGEDYDLTIGSNSFVDDFEQQLIGHGVGESLTVDVTFPADYQTVDLAGKDASFAVTVNGIYEASVFDDAFVQKNLSSYADTAEGYREYLKETNYETNLDQWLASYLIKHTSVTSYPKDYLNNLKSTQKYTDQSTYEYMNQFYTSYTGSPAYTSFTQYTGMSQGEYDISLIDTCKAIEKEAMIYQAILETEGVTVTEDDYKAYLTETSGSADSYDTQVEQYGKGYAIQNMVRIKALEIVKGYATVQ